MALSPAEQVKNALIAKGLETPLVNTGMSAEQKYTRIKGLMTEVVSTLGLSTPITLLGSTLKF